MDASARATREDVVRELGELDELVIARILAVGPSLGEVVEARGRLTDDGDGPLRPPPTAIVDRIVTLVRDDLERLEADDDELSPPL